MENVRLKDAKNIIISLMYPDGRVVPERHKVAMMIAVNAIDARIPKKPLKDRLGKMSCPACLLEVDSGKHRYKVYYCPRCGQAVENEEC